MNDTKQQLVHAARVVVQREGADRLTLDAVAKEAGISKGGVLYHFPTKTALLEGLLTEMVSSYQETIIRYHENTPGGWIRAYILANANNDVDEAHNGFALLAAIANEPSLLSSVRKQYENWQSQAEGDGIDPVMATIVRLAADGLYFADLFGFSPPTGALREEVVERLLQLVSIAAGTERTSHE